MGSRRRFREAKERLTVAEAKYPNKQPHVAAISKLAEVLAAEGDFSEATTLYEQALAMTEKVLGRDSPELSPLLNNLGRIYLDWGRPSEARVLFERAVFVLENDSRYGPEDRNLGSMLTNLAIAYDSERRFSDAQLMYHRALAIKEKTYGENHLYVATTLDHCAASLRSVGKIEEAEVLEERARRIRSAR